MKKLLTLVLALLLTMGATCALAEMTSGDYVYEMLPDGTAMITDYKGKASQVTIPSSLGGLRVTAIGPNAFYNCRAAGVTIPEGVVSIGAEAFSFCTRMEWIALPDSLTTIGDRAFYHCESLTAITIPDGVTTVGANPFPQCTGLTRITVSPNQPVLATIDGVLFEKPTKRLVCYPCAFTQKSYSIPQGIRIVGDYAFYCCESLTDITIPDSVTTIGHSGLAYCKGLPGITLPDGVTFIGDNAFAFCERAKSINVPEGVTHIGTFAFNNCKQLTSITLPDSVATIGETPLSFCYALTSVVVSPDHPVLTLIDGVLIDKSTGTLVYYPLHRKDAVYTVPEGVTIIGNRAFADCDALTAVILPEGVTYIDDYAFVMCDSLQEVTMPASVIDIGNSVFTSCPSLTLITVERNSFAADWCEHYGLSYNYPDAFDWLLD